jgi:hypothetical protein
MSVANILGYFDAATITAVKSLIVPTLGSQSKKRFEAEKMSSKGDYLLIDNEIFLVKN